MKVDEREKLRDWLIIIAISIGLIIGLICVFNAVRTWETQRTIEKRLSKMPPTSSYDDEAFRHELQIKFKEEK